jgi:iron complex transport system permease protein
MLKMVLLLGVLFLPLFAFSRKARKTGGFMTPGRVIRVSLFLFMVFLIVGILSLFFGASSIDVLGLLQWLLSGGGAAHPFSATDQTILLSIRLPRIVFAGIVGGALGAAGVVFQGLLRNPLADPYILGVSSGAAVGALCALLLGVAFAPGVSGSAFLGALITILLVYGIARTHKDLQSATLLLAGVIVNAFFGAVIMFLIATAGDKKLHNAMFWLMGDLSLALWPEIVLAGFILLAGFVVIFVHARPLNLLAVSEETAGQLGVPVERTKTLLLLAASLVTGVVVSVSGIIGFTGLIVPHLMRMLLGSDHRLLLPASVLFGGAFLIAADTIARTILAPSELPVGVITALCGAPYFIYLLRGGR